MIARRVWLAAGVILAVFGVQLVFDRLAGQAAQTPLIPGQVVHHVFTYISSAEPDPPEPADPYHLPKAAYAPTRGTVETWILIRPGGQAGAMLTTTRNDRGDITQVSARDLTGRREISWAPAREQLLRVPDGENRLVDWDSASLAAREKEGFRPVGQVRISGQDARVFERERRSRDDGALYRDQFFVGTAPEGVDLGWRSTRLGADGTMTILGEVATRTYEIVPRTAAPPELTTWTPPPGARLIDPATQPTPPRRSLVASERDIARIVAYRVFRPGSAWAARVIYTFEAPSPGAATYDDGSWNGAIPNGEAVSVFYQSAGSNQVAEVISGPREASLTRLKRTPAPWVAAKPISLTITGQAVTGWLVTFAPDNTAAELGILADLGDTFLMVQFRGFDEGAAVAFASQLAVVQR